MSAISEKIIFEYLNPNLNKGVTSFSEQQIVSIFNTLLTSHNSGISQPLNFSQKSSLNRFVENLSLDKLSIETLKLAHQASQTLQLNPRSTKALIEKLDASSSTSEKLMEPIEPAAIKPNEEESLQKKEVIARRNASWQGLDDKLIASKINKMKGPFTKIHAQVEANSGSLSWYSLLAYCDKLRTEETFRSHKHGAEAAELIVQIIDRLKEEKIAHNYNLSGIIQMIGSTATIIRKSKKLENFLLESLPKELHLLSDKELYMLAVGMKQVSNPEPFVNKIEVAFIMRLNQLSKRQSISLLACCSRSGSSVLFPPLAKRCSEMIGEMGDIELREIIEAAGKFSKQKRGGSCTQCDELVALAMKQCYAKNMDERLQSLICGSLAKGGYKEVIWIEKVLLGIEQGKFNPWNQIIIFHSLAKLGVTNKRIQLLLLTLIDDLQNTLRYEKRMLDLLYTKDLIHLIWAANFHFNKCHSREMGALIKVALDKKELNDVDKLALRTAIDISGYPTEGIDKTILNMTEENVSTSMKQKVVYRYLFKHLAPLGISIKEEVFIGCYPVDFLFSNLTINGCPAVLEIDGPYHFTKPDRAYNGSSQLKNRYLLAQGYFLFRMNICNLDQIDLENEVAKLIKIILKNGTILPLASHGSSFSPLYQERTAHGALPG